MMQDLLMRNGVDPNAITSEEMLKSILNQIDMASKQTAPSGIRNTRSAQILDMEGQTIPQGSQIMGGKAVETEAEIAARLQKGNQDSIQKIKMQKMIDDAIEDASPGFADGDTKYDAELVAENLAARMGLVYDDLPTKQRIDLYDQAYTGLSKQRFKNQKTPKGDDPENMADGGRIGLKGGLTPSDYLKVKDMLEHYHKYKKSGKPRISKADFAREFFRENNADGGRIGLKDGMNRRTFLKFLAGAASIPIVGKIFKPLKMGKTVTKVPIIKTADVAGKPEWFDQLVNKVILEGDDFTKKLSTGERQVVHVKKLDEDTTVTVTQDMDNGVVRVEYDNPANTFEDTVSMQYKKPLPDEGDPRPSAEFEVAESGPVGRRYGPDDYELEVDEVGGTSISDLNSDVSKLKAYATGEKPNMKELVKNIDRRRKAKNITEDQEAQMDAVIKRQGEMTGEDYDYASGGIARMLGE